MTLPEIPIELPPGWAGDPSILDIRPGQKIRGGGEDLWQGRKSGWTLDVGWGSAGYCCQVVQNGDWEHPVHEEVFANVQDVINWMAKWFRVIGNA